jgi:hypothetical protein
MKNRRAWAVGLAAVCSAAATLVVAPSVQVATCTQPTWSNKDPGTGRPSSSGWVPVRTGPNSGCGVVVNVSSTNVLNYDCYTVNSAGNTWTHVRTATGRSGWIYDGHLDDGGSFYRC